MRGHGMTVAAPSVREAVFRSFYTKVNAQVQAQAHGLGDPVFLNRFEVDREQSVWVQWLWWVEEAARRRR